MPIYEVFIDGKPLKTELKRIEERCFTAKMADKSFSIELPADKPDFEKEIVMKVNGKVYKTKMSTINREKFIRVRRARKEATFKTEVKTSMKRLALTTRPTPVTSMRRIKTPKRVGEGVITAPMTGRIISVMVKVGDHVKEGQVACILEAMKMENEITTSKAGIVQKVHVIEGASVSKGETLLVIG